MTLAADLRATALAEFQASGGPGRKLVVRKLNPGAYNAATGASAAAAPPTDTEGVGRLGTYSDRLVNGTSILTGDRRVTFVPLSADAALPQVGNLLVTFVAPGNAVEHEVLRIINVQAREMNGEQIVSTLQVRK